MTRPWCLRRRRKKRRRSPRTSLSSLLSTCSTMGFGGVASGTQLISGIAGGWPLPMGHRPAIRYGGLHGSSAVGHGDVATMVLLSWCLVRQWIQVPASTYCGGASFCSSSSGGYCSFTETGSHSATCYAAVTCTHSANCADDRRDFPGAALGPVFDMPVVVQRHMHCPRVSRSSISVVAQMQSPMVLVVQKTMRFLSCSPLKRWSTSLLGRSSRFHVCCLCEDSRDSTVARVVFVPGQGR